MEKFFAEQATRGEKAKDQSGNDVKSEAPKKLPKGVVIGKDGKPCRSCTSAADWIAMAKVSKKNDSAGSFSTATTAASTTSSLAPVVGPRTDCPPDVEELGRSTWTLLHSISATYPPKASPTQQSEMKQFLGLFAKLYPCWFCADDFRSWMSVKGNEPKVEGQDALGTWMCEAHNEVNRKLGKPMFDCNLWKERWKDGWKDGRCD